jgi:hypothetical protein
MAEVRRPKSAAVLTQWINACHSFGKNLTNWEIKFVASVETQLEESGHLSFRQEDILERIYTEKIR